MLPQKVLEQRSKEPAPGDYDVGDGFDLAWR